MYLILKFVHVLLAITAVGSNITYGIWLWRAHREPQHLSHVLRGVKVLDDRLANPAYALLLVTGLAMLYVNRGLWPAPWIIAALVLYGVIIVVGLLGYTPLLKRQIAVLETSGPEAPDYRAVSARVTLVGVVAAVVLVAIVFLMVTKPRLWG